MLAAMRPYETCRRVLVACALVAGLGVSGVAAADPAAPPGPGSAAADATSWRGRFCTPTSCAPRSGSALGAAAGFGVAVLAAGRLAGRPRG
jgi:hypothetical protein